MRGGGSSIRILTWTAVCAVLAGCGSGGGARTDGTTSETRIPKARFVARADRLCQRSYTESQRLKPPPLPPTTAQELDEVESFLRAQVRIGSRELEGIRALGVAVPGTAAQALNLDAADALVAEMRATAYHAQRVHLGRTRAHYRRAQALSERATKLAERFGFHVCGQGGVHRVLSR